MRILIATLYPNYGGSTKVLLASYEALKEQHQVTLRASFEAATSRTTHAFPLHTLATVAQKLALVPKLARIVLAEWRWLGRNPHDVVYVHDTPALWIYGSIARLQGLKVIHHVHSPEGGGLLRRLRDRLADHPIYIARFAAADARGTDWTLIRNPVDWPDVAPRRRDGRQRLFMAASICARKNQLLGVEIVRELVARGHDPTLELCGGVLEADYADKVRAAIAAAGLSERVRLAGHRPVAEILDAADVVLCLSTWEGQPLAVLEALACGVPVVATPIAAHRELAADLALEPATMPEPATAAALADAILRLSPQAAFDAATRVRAQFSTATFTRELRDAVVVLEGRWHR